MRVAFIFIALLSAISLSKELKGNIIPDFFVTTMDGEDIYRDDFKKMLKPGTKRIVLSFFITSCFTCRIEFAKLKKNISELEKRGVQVYLVNMFKSEEEDVDYDKVKRFVKEYAGNSFPLYVKNREDFLTNDFGLKNIFPTIIILDVNMRVLNVFSGEIDNNFPRVLWSKF